MTEERQIEAIKLLCQLVSDVQSSFKQKAVKKQLASEAFLTVTSLAEGLIQVDSNVNFTVHFAHFYVAFRKFTD